MSALWELLTRDYRTLQGWQWLMMFAIPPLIVALYFLKLKRRPIEVPSTYLWHRTIEDLHVNSLWQKLRQNLLMYLQLLVILMAILACLRPYWQGSQLNEDRYVFLVDTSASMGASDIAPNRLAAAKQKLNDAIDQLRPGSAAMIVSFSDRATVEQPFTTNRRLLKRKANAITGTQRSSELDEALQVAAGLANPGRSAADDTDVAAADALPATLVIFSDGRFRSISPFAMGNLQPVYVPFGNADVQNVGIVAFQTAINPNRPDELRAFGRIQNFGNQPQTVVVRLLIAAPDPQLREATQLELPAGGVARVEFDVEAFEAGELRLELDHRDALHVDNVAFAAINPRRPAKVLLITPRHDALQVALSTPFIKQLAQVTTESVDYLTSESYAPTVESMDLVIYEQCRPDVMPPCNTYFLGELPPDDRWSAGTPVQLPQIIDTDQAHPLMRFVEMGDVMWIVDAQPLRVPPGGTVLVDSHLGPLVAIAPRQGFEDLVQSFSIVTADEAGASVANTDWTIRVSFPVFVGNVLSYLANSTRDTNHATIAPGEPVTLKLPTSVRSISVQTPVGQQHTIRRDADNPFVFGQANVTGVYQVRAVDSAVDQRFAVNLFDTVESNLVPEVRVRTEYEDIPSNPALEAQRIEIWKYLLALALCLLLIEWYIYNRRVYI